MSKNKNPHFEEWILKQDPAANLNWTYEDPKIQLAAEAWVESDRQTEEYWNNKDKPHGPRWPDWIHDEKHGWVSPEESAKIIASTFRKLQD